MPESLTTFKFSERSREYRQRSRTYTAAQTEQISLETGAAASFLVRRSIRDRMPPREAAKLIKQSLGVNRPQAQSLRRFVRNLDPQLSVAARNKAIQKLIDKMIRRRALMIARTVVLDSLNQGVEESWHQAQAQGLLRKTAQKRWLISSVGACEICRAFAAGKTAEVNGYFETPSNFPQRLDSPLKHPTAHPNCRCTIVPVT